MKLFTLNLRTIFLLGLAATLFVILPSCGKKGCTDPLASNYDPDAKKDDNSCIYDSDESEEKALMITTGAQTIEPNETITYQAVFVDVEGNQTPAASVQWSSSNTNVCTISASGSISTAGNGHATIEASVTEGGVTYTASVILNVAIPQVFSVVPSVILIVPGESVPLTPVFFTTETVSYAYSSSNTSIASVNSSGVVTASAVGTAEITVTATGPSGNPIVIVPVLVIGEPEIPLPITRITVDPAAADIFRGDTQQFSAKAFNLDGNEVTASFTWTSADPDIVTVDDNGVVTAKAIGETYIQASAEGVVGQASIWVHPDTVVIVSPFYASLGQGASKQFAAAAYHVKNDPQLQAPLNIAAFDWEIPSYGPGFEMFDVGTVDNTGKVTIKQDALLGMTSFLEAAVPGSSTAIGGAAIMVSIFSADCGNGNPDVATIEITNGDPIQMSLSGNPFVQLNADAKDSSGSAVPNPALKYSSDDTAVVIVDENTGELNAVGMGTATVTVCSGAYASATVTVNVSF